MRIPVETPGDADRQGLARELVDHGEQPQAASVVSAGFHEIIAPHVVLSGAESPSNTLGTRDSVNGMPAGW
jgi:hypothetical protein